MSINTDNKAMKLLRSFLEKKLPEVDKLLETSGNEFYPDDFKVLLGKLALAEELIHEIQATAS